MKTFKQLREEIQLESDLTKDMASFLQSKGMNAQVRSGKQKHKPGVDPTKPQIGQTVVPVRKTFDGPGSKID